MGKKLAILCLCIMLPLVSASAQGTYEDAYNDFKKKAQENYEEFRQKVNKEYAEWMKKAWEWHKKIEPMPSPKDDMLPPIIYNKEKEKVEPKPLPYEEVSPSPIPQPQPKPIAPIRENEGDYRTVVFQFYGTKGNVRLPQGPTFRLRGRDELAYSVAWEELSSEKYNNLVRDCLVLRMEHQLCDWAYLMMLGCMSEAICGKGTNEATMLQAFVYCQSGYKIRLGFTKNRDLRLLFKTEHIVFDLIGFSLDDGMFYTLQPIDGEGLHICDIKYPEEKPLSLWIVQEQKFEERLSKERTLTPSDKKNGIKVRVNENLIDFYNSYPTSMINDDIMSRWAMYANTPLSSEVKERLYPQLKNAIDKAESKAFAANWLLYWVQTAFVYEYDDKVWGHDRAFFAEETLYYPNCDCEDRSILFSRLIRDLLGLDVLLVYYPGHLATAVCFNTEVKGVYINFNGRRFVVCDPTYINAPIGVTMTGMDNQTAKIVLLK